MKWTLARVIKIHLPGGTDVRVVDVKTAKGTFTRAVTNLLATGLEMLDYRLQRGGMLPQLKTNRKQRKLFSTPVARNATTLRGESATTSGKKLFPLTMISF
ncbi:hypothetical protein TNIN_128941 [Trichonephila inaurata madagascariensis]|uniref:DUF5641 domain-containing protein n=1 Tax=Trichonephila inaurata madagascariensis TaxID=2747483 RepID=A0A8X6YBG8_9ARAC|nr:hypothetical protein TNIN_128941 [Trichonephila inaurata madagascariensis]